MRRSGSSHFPAQGALQQRQQAVDVLAAAPARPGKECAKHVEGRIDLEVEEHEEELFGRRVQHTLASAAGGALTRLAQRCPLKHRREGLTDFFELSRPHADEGLEGAGLFEEP